MWNCDLPNMSEFRFKKASKKPYTYHMPLFKEHGLKRNKKNESTWLGDGHHWYIGSFQVPSRMTPEMAAVLVSTALSFIPCSKY